jgi:hypothetical protein
MAAVSSGVGDELTVSAQGLHKSRLMLAKSGDSVTAMYPGGRARSLSSRERVRSGIAREEAVACACPEGVSTVKSLFG